MMYTRLWIDTQMHFAITVSLIRRKQRWFTWGAGGLLEQGDIGHAIAGVDDIRLHFDEGTDANGRLG